MAHKQTRHDPCRAAWQEGGGEGEGGDVDSRLQRGQRNAACALLAPQSGGCYGDGHGGRIPGQGGLLCAAPAALPRFSNSNGRSYSLPRPGCLDLGLSFVRKGAARNDWSEIRALSPLCRLLMSKHGIASGLRFKMRVKGDGYCAKEALMPHSAPGRRTLLLALSQRLTCTVWSTLTVF